MSYARITLGLGLLLVFTIQVNRCSENTTGPGKDTPDTTSHDFTWETFEFGGQNGSSILYDVAIVDENDIWAVGEIYTEDTYTRDSLGNLIKPYNAVHWDGQEWELKHIYVDYRGEPNLAPLKGVFALDNGEVVFSSGLPYLPANDWWKLYHLWDMGIFDENDGGVDNIWGTSLSNLYFAGRNGTIVHYDGQGWTKLESGTDIDLLDVTGSPDGLVAWACGYDSDNGIVLLEIIEDVITPLYSNPNGYWITEEDSLFSPLQSVWSDSPDYFVLAASSGVYTINKSISQARQMWQGPFLYPHYLPGRPYRITGQGINDLFLCGALGFASHYSGKDWQSYSFSEWISWRSVGMKDNMVVLCGTNQSGLFWKSIIGIGRR